MSLPNWVNSQMRHSLKRAPTNPMDRCTVFSLYPKQISEKKPVWPERFVIPAGSIEEPSILIVEPASCWREADPDQPPIEIPISSIQIADSLIRDYCVGMFEVKMGFAQPGIFFIPGQMTFDFLMTKYEDPVTNKKGQDFYFEAAVWQKNWYEALIREADSLWARTAGNPLAISLDMKMAGEHFQMRDKPWMKDSFTMSLVPCPACGNLRNPNFPICQTCKVIVDKEKFAALGMEFAKV